MRLPFGLWLLLGGLTGCAGAPPANDPPPPPPAPAVAGYYRLDTVWLGMRPAGAARAAAGFEPVLRWRATALPFVAPPAGRPTAAVTPAFTSPSTLPPER